MNTRSSPSRYRTCISLRSTIASPTFTPALDVLPVSAQERVLVDLEPHTVAERVREGIAVPRFRDHRPGRGIDLGDPGAGSHSREAGCLRRGDDLADLPAPGRGLPHRDGPGHVRAVSLDQRAEVEGHRLALAQLVVTGVVMRLGAALAEGDDRIEPPVLRAGLAHRDLQFERDRPLGDARLERPAEHHALERLIGRRLRPFDQLDLVGVLAHPEPLDLALERDELDARESVRQPSPGPVRDAGGLETERADAEVADRLWHGRRAVEIDPRIQGRRHLVRRLLRVPAVREEDAASRGDQRLSVGAGETGQETDVREPRHEHAVDAELLEPGREARAPQRVIHRIASSAGWYTPAPAPTREARATGAITERRRNSSRA